MRIRLRIERNELPPVSILWTFTTTQLSETIAQFMQRVNERFPLEGNTWGFEDYAVSLGGYEAQHYCEVGHAFEKDDEVLIKPLGFQEKRARTITGRDQISRDGRHLIDGVPFGRPLLKRVKRPDITIPPRKRRKLGGDGGEVGNALVRFEEVDDEVREDDDEGDEDFEDFEVEDNFVNGRLAAEDAGFAYRGEDGSQNVDEDSEDDDVSDDADFGAEELGAFAEDSDEDSSEEESDSDSDSNINSSSEDSSSDDSDDSSADIQAKPSSVPAASISNSESSANTPSDVGGKKSSLPYEGGNRTKARNARRRESNRLKYLKEAGKLPKNATLADMAEYLKTNPMPSKQSSEAATNREKLEQKRQQLLADIAGGGVDVTGADAQLNVDLAAAVDEQPAASAQESDDEGPDELPIGSAPSAQVETQAEDTEKAKEIVEIAHEPSPAFKRARINLAGANRLVFGSLGVRTPKTQAEKDALQKKLAARPKKAGSAGETAPVEAPVEEDGDPEAWREKVMITAVECVDEGVILSAPPFPFQQRWDPQYRKQRSQNSALYNAGKRSKKRKRNGGEFVETYDKYNQDGGGDALNYDDDEEEEEEEEFEEDEYWEEGALLDGDEAEHDEEVDTFPPLPPDPSTLPTLLEADAAVGDFIVFTEMALSAATNWQPQMLAKRAQIKGRDESHQKWELMMAKSRKAAVYDDDGNRVYEKFEMEGFDQDEEEDMERAVSWGELADVRLLKKGDGGVVEG